MMDSFTSVQLQTVLPGELEAVLSNLDRLEEAISLLNVSKEPSGELWQEAKRSSKCEKCSAKPDPKGTTATETDCDGETPSDESHFKEEMSLNHSELQDLQRECEILRASLAVSTEDNFKLRSENERLTAAAEEASTDMVSMETYHKFYCDDDISEFATCKLDLSALGSPTV